jgi:nucleotide-binding universal stress UspA family protein
MSSVHTILFPTDLSRNAELAFPFACALARDLGAAMIVLHVYPPPIDHSEALARRQEPPYEEDLQDLLHQYQSPELPGGLTHRLEEGGAVEEILRVAREVPCDLIIMGLQGRHGLSRLVLGSVADEVLRRAACPVLTMTPAVLAALRTRPTVQS